jgi:hypothetical protein
VTGNPEALANAAKFAVAHRELPASRDRFELSPNQLMLHDYFFCCAFHYSPRKAGVMRNQIHGRRSSAKSEAFFVLLRENAVRRESVCVFVSDQAAANRSAHCSSRFVI